MSDVYNVRLSHKHYCFVRTESRFFDISEAETLANGLVPNAAQNPDSAVADLVAQGERYLQKLKCKASNIRRFQKREEAEVV